MTDTPEIVFHLQELQRRGAEKGIVQDAVLIGAPVTGEVTKWRPLLQVVAGRLVNAYSRSVKNEVLSMLQFLSMNTIANEIDNELA